MGIGVGRVDIGVVFRHTLLADQGLGQPVGMVDIVEAETALDAEPVVVGGTVAAIDRDDAVVLDLVGQLAADAAIGAHAVDFAVGGVGIEPFASTRVAGINAPVGQACTHSPQATQVLLPIGSSKSNTIFS